MCTLSNASHSSIGEDGFKLARLLLGFFIFFVCSLWDFLKWRESKRTDHATSLTHIGVTRLLSDRKMLTNAIWGDRLCPTGHSDFNSFSCWIHRKIKIADYSPAGVHKTTISGRCALLQGTCWCWFVLCTVPWRKLLDERGPRTKRGVGVNCGGCAESPGEVVQ